MAERSLYGRTPVIVSIAMAVTGALVGAVILTLLLLKEAITVFSMVVLAIVGGVVLAAGIVSLYLRPRLRKEFLEEHGLADDPQFGKVIQFPGGRGRHTG